ncbi:hypothetical protein [Nitrospirillum bahiense]|uniref:hypothetical protein n=1 Tax=Nitrospirillum amazonense TaxID=28077 RepID=UPI0011A32F9F|nr:hypothetical protein [Nitrospirillum amazonense]
MNNVFTYISITIIPLLKWCGGGYLLAIDKILKRFFPVIHEKFGVIPQKTRTTIEVFLIISGVFYVVYSAWNDEYENNQKIYSSIEKQIPSDKENTDPDGIYQGSEKVGQVVGAEQNLSESKITFKEIQANGDFSKETLFKYRGYYLLMTNSDSATRNKIGNKIQSQTFYNAECQVLTRP